MVYGIVYLITNTMNGKRYVGQTTHTLEHRQRAHLRSPRNRHLAHAFRRYGRDAFVWHVLREAASQEVLDKLEDQFILAFNTLDRRFGYNLRRGGAQGRLSDEVKRRIAAAKTGQFLGDHTREKISTWHKSRGSWVGDDNPWFGKGSSLRGDGNPMFGRRHTMESKEKMAAKLRGREGRAGTANPMHGVVPSNAIEIGAWVDGKFVGWFKSVTEAADFLGYGVTRLSRGLQGVRPLPAGLLLKRKDC